jgi:prepilin-type N-terminal cleavage/methylation domain-containing protein
MRASPRRRDSHNRPGDSGFTLVEVMIVVVIIGILAALALPQYARSQRKARIGRTAGELRNISTAFVTYYAANGRYPPDSHLALPPGMDEFLAPAIWADGTPIGGNYNWEGPDGYPYAGISIFPADAVPNEDLLVLDALLDNGDLASGRFRLGTSGRPTYIIEE